MLTRLELMYRSGVPHRGDIAPEDVNRVFGHVLPMNYVEDFGGGLPTAGTRKCCYYGSGTKPGDYLMFPEIFVGPTGKVFPLAQIASGMALDTSTRVGRNVAGALGSLIGYSGREYISGLRQYGMQIWLIPRIVQLPDKTFVLQNVDFAILPKYVTDNIVHAYSQLNGVRYLKTTGGYRGLGSKDAWIRFVGNAS